MPPSNEGLAERSPIPTGEEECQVIGHSPTHRSLSPDAHHSARPETARHGGEGVRLRCDTNTPPNLFGLVGGGGGGVPLGAQGYTGLKSQVTQPIYPLGGPILVARLGRLDEGGQGGNAKM